MSSKPQVISPNIWSTPPVGFIKIKFDGAQKDNLHPTGYRGVFHNATREILWIYACHIGEETNNFVELSALEAWLHISIHQGYTKLLVEGGSQILIQMTKQLISGSKPSNIYNNQRLEYFIESIATLVLSILVLIPIHV